MKDKPPRMASVDTLVRLARKGENGRFWYRHAMDQVEQAATLIGVESRYLADLLALFSPRVSVKRSIRFALRYAINGDYASDVMRGIQASVEYYYLTGEILGQKTSAFARALRGDESAIVLDVWMAKAFGIDQKLFQRISIQEKCKRRIRNAAKRLGWIPAQTQAAIWTATVRQAGRNPAQLTLVEDTLFGLQLENAA